MPKQALINSLDDLDRLHRQIAEMIRAKPVIVTLRQGATRTLEQNAYLWGVCYPTILDQAGEDLAGWRKEDLHEYFLGEHFGWETLEGFGRKRLRPLERSSPLNKQDFSDYIAYIQQFAAERGIVIPDPEPRDD